jgi:HD-like signal output (HDOD) protein
MSAAIAVDPAVKAKEAVKKVTSISTLPEVTARIISMVEDPKSSAADLRQIVSHDPALVTRILKVVNSSFYGLSGQVSSIERAIVLLGLNAVKNTAVAASMGGMFRASKLCEGFTAKDLWAHCVAVAVTARELARQINPELAEQAFLSGMIHDVGILVSLQLWPEKLRSVCEEAKKSASPFPEIEAKHLGLDHQQLGRALAEQWSFPKPCQLAAGFHHDVSTLFDEGRPLVSIIYAADVICCRSKHGFNLTAFHQTLDGPAAGDVVSADIVADVTAKLDELVCAATPLLAA